MTSNEPMTILYFEDDLDIAGLTCDFLQNCGHQVIHLDRWPDNGILALRELVPKLPQLVLLDVNLPQVDGTTICQYLRDDYLSADCAVVFTSGLMEDEDIMRAYAAGADDYLIKPVRLQELQIKISQVRKARLQVIEQESQAQSALQMAFDAMRTSSELGEILRFQETLHQLKSLDDIAAASFDILQNFQLQASILFFVDAEPVFYRADQMQPRLERESMLTARSRGRMYHWRQLTFLNFDLVTILFRNMPIDDEARYGVAKDQICLLFNGMDAKLNALMLERSESEKQQKLKSISAVLGAIAREIEQSSVGFAEQFERILVDMETNLRAELAQFNLLESEEQAIMIRIEESLNAATQLFDESLSTGKQQKIMLDKLLSKLTTYS
jgi:DNA-binding response OmpR family regulator